MAVITSPDTLVSATVVIANPDNVGRYEIQITAVTPTGVPISVVLGAESIYQGAAHTGSGTE